MSVLNLKVSVRDTLMYTGDDESKLDLDPNYNDPIIKNEFIQIRKVVITGCKTEALVSVSPAPLNTADRSNDLMVTLNPTGEFSNITVEIKPEDSKHIVNSGLDADGVEHIIR